MHFLILLTRGKIEKNNRLIPIVILISGPHIAHFDMKNLAFLKSLVVACALSCVFTSCVEETLYRIDKEEVEILNNLTLSEGKIQTGKENALDLKVSLAQDTILVEEFSELALASADLQFSDSQEASLTDSAKGDAYKVEKISYRDYSVEEYSLNRRKVTLNFTVKYSYEGEVRDTVLSPWYFQEKPEVLVPQEPTTPVDVVTAVPTFEFKNNGKGTVTSTVSVNWFKNGELDFTHKAVLPQAKSGSVSGTDIYTVSSSCTKAEMQCDTLSISEKVVKDHFTVTTEERLYRWRTTFISTTGGEITPKNEIKVVFVSKIVYEYDGFRYTWTFNCSANDVVRAIEDKGLEGKVVEGTYSPYLGTYVLKVNSYLFSPQVPELDGSTPFHSSVAENNLYQRESVV